MEIAMVCTVKKEPISEKEEVKKVVHFEDDNKRLSWKGSLERRVLRSQYLTIKDLISYERDDFGSQDSKKFKSIITQVEALHENVNKPREQVADAETLLEIASTLVISVRSQNNEGVTPSNFIAAILKIFGGQQHKSQAKNTQNMVSWVNIGFHVTHFLESVPGCCTMNGPMSNEIKLQKRTFKRKRAMPTDSTCPEEIDCMEHKENFDTDGNMSTMFDILKKKRRVHLECLLLNRLSFAQTVENIFALSFLVKDGRAGINVDDNGQHLVFPRNAPAASQVVSRAVSYHHFVFRFDFMDWKSMKEAVGLGEELMPHRSPLSEYSHPGSFHRDTQLDAFSSFAETNAALSTPIRKFSCLIVQEDSIVEDSGR